MRKLKWTTLGLSVGVSLFTFIIPLLVVFTTYFKIVESPKVGISLVGIFLVISIILLWVRGAKKRIKMRTEQGFYNSPYKVLVVSRMFGLGLLLCFTWFLNVIRTDIVTLRNVMVLVTASVYLGFGLDLLQVKYEKLLTIEIKRKERDLIEGR